MTFYCTVCCFAFFVTTLSFNIYNKICNKNLPMIARYVVIFLYNADKDCFVYLEIKVKF